MIFLIYNDSEWCQKTLDLFHYKKICIKIGHDFTIEYVVCSLISLIVKKGQLNLWNSDKEIYVYLIFQETKQQLMQL